MRVVEKNSATKWPFTDTAMTKGMPNTKQSVSITTDCIFEEPCEGKLSSTVLKPSGEGDLFA